ncbi:Uncharacterised protein [Mycobacteroides abscessus subsp. massiliense]|nr:Uncharacterised protein [Mycobacteroides abscessus subsp. massiliense]
MPHTEVEIRLLASHLGQHVQQIPLRHHRDIGVRGAQPGEVGHHNLLAVRPGHSHPLQLCVGQLVESIEETQLVEQPQGGRVHGVAAEVPQKIAVLLQHDDLYPGPGEEQTGEYARRTATHHDTCRLLAHLLAPLMYSSTVEIQIQITFNGVPRLAVSSRCDLSKDRYPGDRGPGERGAAGCARARQGRRGRPAGGSRPRRRSVPKYAAAPAGRHPAGAGRRRPRDRRRSGRARARARTRHGRRRRTDR